MCWGALWEGTNHLCPLQGVEACKLWHVCRGMCGSEEQGSGLSPGCHFTALCLRFLICRVGAVTALPLGDAVGFPEFTGPGMA